MNALRTPPAHLDELLNLCETLNVSVPVSDNLDILFEPVTLGAHVTPNRFVALPMEGFDSYEDGSPGPLTIRRYERFASGGSGVVWFEAMSVCPEGRSNPHQLMMRSENRGAFGAMVKKAKAAAFDRCGHRPVLIAQLTHSGRYSRPDGTSRPVVPCRSEYLDRCSGIAVGDVCTDEYLYNLMDTFLDSAGYALEAGFDGVDIKCCHGYLLSGLLGARSRPGDFGGSYENRTRMVRETVASIAKKYPEALVAVRINAFDGIDDPDSWGSCPGEPLSPDLSEPLRLVQELEAANVPLVSITLGNPRIDPHLGRPSRNYRSEKVHREHPLEGIARFNTICAGIQESSPGIAVVNAGLSWLRQLFPIVAAGLVAEGWCKLTGQGRNVLAYPDSVNDLRIQGGFDPRKCCQTCSLCSMLMKYGGPSGCPVRDRLTYGPILKKYHKVVKDDARP